MDEKWTYDHKTESDATLLFSKRIGAKEDQIDSVSQQRHGKGFLGLALYNSNSLPSKKKKNQLQIFCIKN